MRLATAASAAVLALSAAALAQVGAAQDTMTANNTMTNATGPGNATMPADPMPAPDATADNMMDNSAAPPPSEPK